MCRKKKVLTSNGTYYLLQSDPSYEYILTSNTVLPICSIPNTVPQIWIFITTIAPTTTNVFTITSPSFFISGPDHSFKTFPYNTASFVFQLIHRLAFLFSLNHWNAAASVVLHLKASFLSANSVSFPRKASKEICLYCEVSVSS